MFHVSLLDQDAQNLAKELIWKQIEFSVKYVDSEHKDEALIGLNTKKVVFSGTSQEFEQIIRKLPCAS